MELDGNLKEVTFLRRLNLFLIEARIGSRKVDCFIPNPARLKELLLPGARIFLREVEGVGRKTKYELVLLLHKGKRSIIDSRFANRIFQEALEQNLIKELKGYKILQHQPRFGRSRLDFLLEKGTTKCLVEVKCTSLPRGNVAIFPDAPTQRGKRQLLDLILATKRGFRAAIVFIAQAEGVKSLYPNVEVDPGFCELLGQAVTQGVRPLAYACRFRKDEIRLGERIPIRWAITPKKERLLNLKLGSRSRPLT